MPRRNRGSDCKSKSFSECGSPKSEKCEDPECCFLASAATLRSTRDASLSPVGLLFPINQVLLTIPPFNASTTVIPGSPAIFDSLAAQVGFLLASPDINGFYTNIFYTLEAPGVFEVSATLRIVPPTFLPGIFAQILFVPYNNPAVPQVVTSIENINDNVFVITPVTFQALVRGRFEIRFGISATLPFPPVSTTLLRPSSVFTVFQIR